MHKSKLGEMNVYLLRCVSCPILLLAKAWSFVFNDFLVVLRLQS